MHPRHSFTTNTTLSNTPTVNPSKRTTFTPLSSPIPSTTRHHPQPPQNNKFLQTASHAFSCNLEILPGSAKPSSTHTIPSKPPLPTRNSKLSATTQPSTARYATASPHLPQILKIHALLALRVHPRTHLRNFPFHPTWA